MSDSESNRLPDGLHQPPAPPQTHSAAGGSSDASVPISPEVASNVSQTTAPKPQRSSRSIRSTPLPPGHNFKGPQHLTGSASHQRQYVLLRDKTGLGNSNSSLGGGGGSGIPSPKLSANTTTATLASNQSPGALLPPGKPRPFLRKAPSSKYIFSVDDDEDEVEEDLNREYLEGYNDALRHRFKLLNVQGGDGGDAKTRKVQEIESDIAQNLLTAARELNGLRDREGDAVHSTHSRISYDEEPEDASVQETLDEEPTLREGSGGGGGAVASIDATVATAAATDATPNHDDVASETASISSAESFTLRGRQDAINETHPFGIRIWKPAIYKKNRSVEIEAENDIHSTPHSARTVGASVAFFNLIWSCSFGLLLFLLCLTMGVATLLFSMLTDPRTNDSMKYAKLYMSLGRYLLFPFGKLILLRSEKNYIGEDANVGSSLAEFRQWRTQEEGRLFYAAPNLKRRNPTETTPLNSVPSQQYLGTAESNSDEEDDENATFYKQRMFGRGKWNVGRVVFFLFFYLVVQPVVYLIGSTLWLLVFTIPMAKVLFTLCSHIKRHPLALSFKVEKDYYQTKINTNTSNESILICTYRCLGFHYYKYTVDGTNIFFINLIFLVVFTIFDFFVLKEYFELSSILVSPSLIFILCLVSIVPLAYFIGQAVASISAQTSMGLGAAINAFFSTIVEVFLYCVALDQHKGKLVEGSMIGSILAAVLLLPGTSMCGGALKRKTQRYNPASAGVSSTMLLYAVLVMLSPTILYEIYGQYEVQCFACESNVDGRFGEDCKKCHFLQPNLAVDELYTRYLQPYTIICAIGLFLAYFIGLLFTLKTHAALIWSTPVVAERERQLAATPVVLTSPETNSVKSLKLDAVSNISRKTQPMGSTKLPNKISAMPLVPVQQAHQQEEAGGHDAPNWSRKKSTTILLLSTLLYAIIAEILVDVVDDVLSVFPINPKFLGLTVFALVPNTTEFVNAFSFATHGNVALSMEIGSAYALQVCLLQIPIVTLYSTFKNAGSITADINSMFALVFPRWDFIASLISVYMFTYVYAEGKSNYFKGSILILLYISVLTGFYFSIVIDANGLNRGLGE